MAEFLMNPKFLVTCQYILVLITVFLCNFLQSAEVPGAHFISLSDVTVWLITQIQFACKPLCCLSLLMCLPGKHDPWHRPHTFLHILATLVWREQQWVDQDATLTEGKRKWSHSSPARSYKKMVNSEGKHWYTFHFISVDCGACVDASPSLPVCIPVAQTLACTSCFHCAQLWTDGWHSVGQYVRPDGAFQEILQFFPVAR